MYVCNVKIKYKSHRGVNTDIFIGMKKLAVVDL